MMSVCRCIGTKDVYGYKLFVIENQGCISSLVDGYIGLPNKHPLIGKSLKKLKRYISGFRIDHSGESNIIKIDSYDINSYINYKEIPWIIGYRAYSLLNGYTRNDIPSVDDIIANLEDIVLQIEISLEK